MLLLKVGMSKLKEFKFLLQKFNTFYDLYLYQYIVELKTLILFFQHWFFSSTLE